MGFFDSLVGGFTGSSQRKDMRRGASRNDQYLQEGMGEYNTGRDSAKNYLQPFYDQGGQAYTQYSNALGVNGNDAQQGYWDNYQADPQRGYDEGRAVQSVNRLMSARGMSKGGYAALAGARAGMDAGRSYTQDRLNRLQGLSGQGAQAGMAMGNYDMQAAGGLAGLSAARGQNQAALAQGLAGTRNMGFQNTLGLLSLGSG